MMVKEWEIVTLKQVLSPVERSEIPIPGKVYRQIGVKLWGEGAYERESIEGSQTKYKKLFRVEVDDIIVNKIWARNGSVAVVTNELDGCYGSNEFPTFVPIKDKLYPDWFNWLTKTQDFWKQCDEKSQGTSGKNRIRPERFLEIEVPLPPLQEQQHIVARIEELATKIEEARVLSEQAQEQTKALMPSEISDIFSKGKEKNWTTGQLGDFIIDIRYGTSRKSEETRIGKPILRMGNIQNGRLDFRNLKYLRLEDKERVLLLNKGDILVNRTNSAELVGKCAVFDNEGEYAFASYLIRIRLDTTRALPSLVVTYINSPLGRAYMFSERKQMTGQANINSTKLKAMPIVLPPISEQRRIVAYLDKLQAKVDFLKQLQDETAAELNALLPSVLDKAFKGKL